MSVESDKLHKAVIETLENDVIEMRKNKKDLANKDTEIKFVVGWSHSGLSVKADSSLTFSKTSSPSLFPKEEALIAQSKTKNGGNQRPKVVLADKWFDQQILKSKNLLTNIRRWQKNHNSKK